MPTDPPSTGSSPGDRDYSWLYGGSSRSGGDSGRDGGSSDSERTQVVPAPGVEATRDRTQRVPAPASGAAPARSSTGDLPPMRLPPPGLSRDRPSATRGATGAGSSAGTPQSGRSRRRSGRRWGRILALLLAVWVLFLLAVPIYAWSKITKVDAEPDGDRPADQPGTTYLLVGSDSRDGLDPEQRAQLSTGGDAGGSRTDTLLLLHVGDGKPLLLSIPRDSPVEIPGHGSRKINTAFNSDLYDDGGPELLVSTIETNTGIRVDDYVEVGFGGFVDVVDALGGIQICPKEPIQDKLAGLDLPQGCQEADGATALGFARSRHTFALQDLTRVQNQRDVIASIGSQAASPWTVLNPVRYWRLASSGASSLTIGDNVGPFSLARFAWTMSRIDSDGLSCTVPVITSSSSLQWDPDLAPQVFDAVANDSTDDITKAMCRSTGQ